MDDDDDASVAHFSNAEYAGAHAGADGGAQIQAAIDEADSRPGPNVVVVEGSGPDDVSESGGAPSDDALARNAWKLSAPLTVPSFTALLFRNCYLFLADGVDDNVLRNEALDAGGRDRDIALVGANATVDGNNENQYQYARSNTSEEAKNVAFRLHKVDRLQIRGLFFRRISDWSIKAEDVTNASFLNLSFDNTGTTGREGDDVINQDGVDVRGPAKNVNVSHVRGVTGDDLVAVLGNDPDNMDGDGGPIENVSVSDVMRTSGGANAGSAVRVNSGVGASVRNVAIENVGVEGSTGRGAVVLGGRSRSQFRNVSVDNVVARNNRAVYVERSVSGVSLGGLHAEGGDDAVLLVGDDKSGVTIDGVRAIDCAHAVRNADGATLSASAIENVVAEGSNVESVVRNESGLLDGVTVSEVTCDAENATVVDFDGDATDLRVAGVNARRAAALFDVTGSVDGQVTGVNAGAVEAAYAATGNLAFDPSCPPFDAPPANVLGTRPIASSSWDPDGDGNGEIVAGDGTNWNEVVDLPDS